jgi:hypothetical protein
VTNVLSHVGSQGGVHCEGFVQVARVARSPVRMAARLASRATRSERNGDRAPDRGCQGFFLFYTFVEIMSLIAPVDLGAVF